MYVAHPNVIIYLLDSLISVTGIATAIDSFAYVLFHRLIYCTHCIASLSVGLVCPAAPVRVYYPDIRRTGRLALDAGHLSDLSATCPGQVPPALSLVAVLILGTGIVDLRLIIPNKICPNLPGQVFPGLNCRA